MIIKSESLEDYFNKRVENLNCRKDTSAYIANTLHNYKNSVYNFTNKSLTLEFAEAKFKASFEKYNELADYLFFMESIFPGALSLKGASQEYYHALASSAYYRCYILMNRTWLVYEEIADRFTDLTNQLNTI